VVQIGGWDLDLGRSEEYVDIYTSNKCRYAK